jgi:Fur family ferric uptake transcriptional regulator
LLPQACCTSSRCRPRDALRAGTAGEEGAAPRFECDDCHRQFRLSQGAAKVQSALQQVLQALATAGHQSLAVDIAVHGRCAAAPTRQGAAA